MTNPLAILTAAWSAWICTKTHQADHHLSWHERGDERYVLYVRCHHPDCNHRSSGVEIGGIDPSRFVRPLRPPFWWLKAETGLQKAYAGQSLKRLRLAERVILAELEKPFGEMTTAWAGPALRSALAQFRSEGIPK